MKLTKNKFFLLLALAGLGIATPDAKAVTTYSDGDILVGFHATGGTGNTKEVVVDLGSYNQFVGLAANTTFTLSVASISGDLTAAYGSPLATALARTDLFWGAMGNDGITDIFATRARTSPDTQSTPWTVQDYFTTGFAYSTVSTVGNNYAGRTSGSSTAVTTETTATGTWTSFAPLIGQNPNNFLPTGTAGIDGNAPGSSTLDLFRIDGQENGLDGPSTYLGKLTLNSTTGQFSFSNSVVAVPEPSRAILLVFGLTGVVLRRRRKA